MAAGKTGNFDAAHALIEAGAQHDAKNELGQTAEDVATAARHDGMAEYLHDPPEWDGWQKVDSLNRASLQAFLKQFPSGTHAQYGKLALELQNQFAAIRTGKSQPQVLIPLPMLGDRWKNWQQRRPEKSVAGYGANQSGVLYLMFDRALHGGATPGTDSISFDGGGAPASPTGDGSIIAFQTNGARYEYLKGVVITTTGKGTMYFGVWAGKGLVHLKGAGSITLPDGKKVDLK
jgi:hypothetical protein